jgi:MFS family permease
VDVRRERLTIFGTPAVAFAAGALLADLAVLALPWNGTSLLASYVAGGFSSRVKVANLLAAFAVAVAILVGLVLLRRGRATLAFGVFVGVLVVVGLRVMSSALLVIYGWRWQTLVILGLQTIECALLFLAAGAARRDESIAT